MVLLYGYHLYLPRQLNILVNSECRAVITDFGSARPVYSTGEPMVGVDPVKVTNAQPKHPAEGRVRESLRAEISSSGEFVTVTGPDWSVRWAAPELLAGGVPELPSDIWALGWICWEVC